MSKANVRAAALNIPAHNPIIIKPEYDIIPPLCEDGMGNEVEFPTFILHH